MVYEKAFIVILILVFFLRLPSLFEPFTYGDEGIYLTLGQAMRQGVALYREIHDNKPPLLYLLAALAGSFAYFRLILFVWSLATVYLFLQLAQRVLPQRPAAALVATAAFAILSSIHTFEGNVANAENFMMLPIIAGFFLIWENLKLNSVKPFFLAGTLFSLAALFKVPAAFDFLAALVFLVLVDRLPRLGKRFLGLTAGFVLPLLVTFIYFAFQGALLEYFAAAFGQNIPYLSSWGMDKSETFGLPLTLLARGLGVALLAAGLLVWRKKVPPTAKLVLVWFAFSLFAALLSSRPYPHYLLQVMPSLSLAAGLLFAPAKERLIPLLLASVLLMTYFGFDFWRYPNQSYYLNFYRFALGLKSRSDYFDYFGDSARTNYQVADYIQSHTQPQERIFIWGTQPSIYALSRRLPAGRYTATYHIVDFEGFQETMVALKEKQPSLIIKMKDEKHSFPELESLLKRNYLYAKTIGKAQIYQRI